MTWIRAGILVLAAVICQAAAERTFEVRGRIEPIPLRATVVLSGATTPFVIQTVSDSGGRFQFRKIRAGTYKVYVVSPGIGEIERTVEVGPSMADSRGRVAVELSLSTVDSPRETAERQYTVNAKRLAIPQAAVREYTEARKLLSANKVDQAVRRMEKAVEIAPKFAAVWNNLGTIAFHAKRYPDAEAYFRKALEASPGDYHPSVNLGAAILMQGRFEEALKYNLFALGQQPGDPLANAQTGQTYLSLGNLDLAIRYLGEAKRLDPNHFSFPQLYLARIYWSRSEFKAAAAELDDFLARHPDSPQAPRIREQLDELRKQ